MRNLPQAPVTLVPPGRTGDDRGISSVLPPDLVEQVRDRVALLSLLLFIAFAFEPGVDFAVLGAARVSGRPVPDDVAIPLGVRLMAAAAGLASLGLWWVARKRLISATRLHWIGLVYEVVICFVIAFGTMWEYAGRFHMLPFLTWLP